MLNTDNKKKKNEKSQSSHQEAQRSKNTPTLSKKFFFHSISHSSNNFLSQKESKYWKRSCISEEDVQRNQGQSTPCQWQLIKSSEWLILVKSNYIKTQTQSNKSSMEKSQASRKMRWSCRQGHGHHSELLKAGYIWGQEECNCKDWDIRPSSDLFTYAGHAGRWYVGRIAQC